MRRFFSFLATLSLLLTIAASAQTTMPLTGTGLGAPSGGGASLSCSYTPVTTGMQNVAYSGGTPSASGGTAPYTYSVSSGTLPAGLSISSSTGQITGNPTTVQTQTGLQVLVTDNVAATANCGTTFQIAISYQGPGDVVTGAIGFWSCGRAYNSTYAASAGNLCDVVLTTGGAAACTIKAATNGQADLAGSYCAGSTTLATACAAGCSISKMYDQTGTGHNAVQAALAVMPPLILNALNGLPCGGGGTGITMGTNSISQSSPYTFTFVGEQVTAGRTTSQVFMGQGGTSPIVGNAAGTSGSWRANFGSAVNNTNASDNAFHSAVIVSDSGAGYIFVIDSTTPVTSTLGTTAFSGFIGLFSSSSTSTSPILAGNFACEFGLWPSSMHSTYTNMTANMHAAHGGWNF